jgi:hypothetical protein
MTVLPPCDSGPAYAAQRSLLFPILPFVAGELPTKTRAFFN